jgi:transporter family protein
MLFSGAPSRRSVQVAPIDKLSVVVAIGLGMLILREKLDLREGIGAALIVVGALVLALK